jgi:hypothetical protein
VSEEIGNLGGVDNPVREIKPSQAQFRRIENVDFMALPPGFSNSIVSGIVSKGQVESPAGTFLMHYHHKANRGVHEAF